MSEPKDPNQPHRPESYPRMLYATPTRHLIVHDEAEEAEAREAGWTDYEHVNETSDDLTTMSKEHLIDEALRLGRFSLSLFDREDLMETVRGMRKAKDEHDAEARAKADAEAAAAKPPAVEPAAPPNEGGEGGAGQDGPDFDAMDDDALRAFILGKTDKKPHPNAKRPKLLELAAAAHHPGKAE